MVFFLACGLLSACKEKVVIEEVERSQTLSNVRVVYTPGGLGDRDLQDEIYKGILMRDRFKDEEIDFIMENYCLEEFELQEIAIADWFEDPQTGTYKNRLLILADNRYVDYLLEHPEWKIPEGDAVLALNYPYPLTEPWQNVYTRAISSYASAYMGAHIMKFLGRKHPTIVCSNFKDIMQREICDGFIDGLHDVGIEFDERKDIQYLDSLYEGYAMSDFLYEFSSIIEHDDDYRYDFVVPACGNSIQGLLRYTREHPETFLTCGVNVDQQFYSNKVAFSTIKDMQKLVDHFLGSWLAGEDIETNAVYGFESIYSDIVISYSYEDKYRIIEDLYPSVFNKMLEAEKEYLKR